MHTTIDVIWTFSFTLWCQQCASYHGMNGIHTLKWKHKAAAIYAMEVYQEMIGTVTPIENLLLHWVRVRANPNSNPNPEIRKQPNEIRSNFILTENLQSASMVQGIICFRQINEDKIKRMALNGRQLHTQKYPEMALPVPHQE